MSLILHFAAQNAMPMFSMACISVCFFIIPLAWGLLPIAVAEAGVNIAGSCSRSNDTDWRGH